jgi:hypothetical protein
MKIIPRGMKTIPRGIFFIPRGRDWVSCEFFGKREENGAVSWGMESISCGMESVSREMEMFFQNPNKSGGFFQFRQKKWVLVLFWWKLGVCGGDLCDS